MNKSRFPTPNTTIGLDELRRRVEAHIAVNSAQLDGFPLILAVVGDTGIGKTFSIRAILRRHGIMTIELSSASLAHHKEGMALYPLIRHYRDCGLVPDTNRSCLIVDDFDRSIASGFEASGHTIHSQLIVGFLMDLCDNPYSVPDEERRVTVGTRRVPIIMTGNDFSRLDPALTRPQRMTVVGFAPTLQDKTTMVYSAFAGNGSQHGRFSPDDAAKLVRRFPDDNIAFFSDIVSEHLLAACTRSSESPLALPIDALRRALEQEMQSLTLNEATRIGEKLRSMRNGLV